ALAIASEADDGWNGHREFVADHVESTPGRGNHETAGHAGDWRHDQQPDSYSDRDPGDFCVAARTGVETQTTSAARLRKITASICIPGLANRRALVSTGRSDEFKNHRVGPNARTNVVLVDWGRGPAVLLEHVMSMAVPVQPVEHSERRGLDR